MNKNELIIKYSNEIAYSKDKTNTTINIINEIENSTYDDGNKLSLTDMDSILTGILYKLLTKYRRKIMRTINERDNESYISILTKTIRKIKEYEEQNNRTEEQGI